MEEASKPGAEINRRSVEDLEQTQVQAPSLAVSGDITQPSSRAPQSESSSKESGTLETLQVPSSEVEATTEASSGTIDSAGPEAGFSSGLPHSRVAKYRAQASSGASTEELSPASTLQYVDSAKNVSAASLDVEDNTVAGTPAATASVETEEPIAPPSEQEISDYAEYLGMVPGEDGPFLWIAEQALCAPLPEGWRELEDHLGRTFYLNSVTSESRWDHPYDEDYQKLFEGLKQATGEQVPTKDEVEEMGAYLGIDVLKEPRLLWIARQASLAPLPPGYRELEDENGHVYFYDQETDESTREHPLDIIFKQLVEVERERLGEFSLVRAANVGMDEARCPMQLTSDGTRAGAYIYDWITGEQTSLSPPQAPPPLPEPSSESKLSDANEKGVKFALDGEKKDEDSSAASTVEKSLARAPLTSRRAGITRRGMQSSKASSQTPGRGSLVKSSALAKPSAAKGSKHQAENSDHQEEDGEDTLVARRTVPQAALGWLTWLIWSPISLTSFILALTQAILLSPVRALRKIPRLAEK
ncbi:hypothetical protein CYMTET_29673 [Cymbomonas tetramitiformis]|uniref:WW domain-containing protein n=1 Tax=Cymbomonas tetramitiformis TaxID=36881 RepID=A0AAE0FKT4_9CHLO|nr:hypothetical protein CYMTET_29673 [Cymbomonas tetramitiformis]